MGKRREEDDSVVVENVKFEDAGNDWVAINIDIRAKAGTKTTGTSKNNNQYVDNVKVRLLIAYRRGENAETLDYFSSEIELVTMEKGKKYTVQFYMCGPVLKREKYTKEPFGYCVQIDVGGKILDTPKKNMSERLYKPEVLQSFLSRVGSESSKTDGTLIPSYDIPSGSLGRDGLFMKDAPVYRIRSKK